MLCETNTFPFDPEVRFEARGHRYFVHDAPVPLSVTKLVSRHFGGFDADAIIGNHFGQWKANASSKYHDQIASCTSDADAKRAIKAEWTRNGAEARRLGTTLHKVIEDELNGAAVDEVQAGAVSAEREAFHAWLAGPCAARALTPHRTEVNVFGRGRNGAVSVAGCVDALFRDADGKFWLVDWKRSKPFGPSDAHFGRYGNGAAKLVKDTAFSKYCLQLAVYAALLADLGVDVGDRRLLVRFSADEGAIEVDANFDGCDDVARAMLDGCV